MVICVVVFEYCDVVDLWWCVCVVVVDYVCVVVGVVDVECWYVV